MTTAPVMRRDLLTGRWVIYAPARGHRPIRLALNPVQMFDPVDDPFAEGQESQTPPEVFALRDSASTPNDIGWHVRVIPNRFPALGHQANSILKTDSQQSAQGLHEVVIESPRFEKSFSQLTIEEITLVWTAYRERMKMLCDDARFQSIAIFKNEGLAAGASLPHVHSQLMGLEFVPPMLEEEFSACSLDWKQRGRAINQNWFEQHLASELDAGQRVITSTEKFTVICPYASRFAYEMHLISRPRQSHFADASDLALRELAGLLKGCLTALEKLVPGVAYNYCLHTAPLVNTQVPFYHWHVEVYPRINGLAGFECGFGCHINTIMPEVAAARIKENF